MKLKQNLLLIITTFLLFMSASSQAARQGVSFYYGLGQTTGLADNTDFDLAIMGDIMFGIEEDGWALEATAFGGLDATSGDGVQDYSTSGTNFSFIYRTAGSSNWFKYKISITEMDFKYTTAPTNKTDGLTYTIGWGFRASRESRIEIDYNFYSIGNQDNQPVNLEIDAMHMIRFSYFWGGPEYKGRKF